MGYDAATHQLIMFGGGASRMYADTWQFKDSTWTQLHPKHSPSARQGAAMAYDPDTRQLLMYGGTHRAVGDESKPLRSGGVDSSYNDAVYSDTWAWDGNDWKQLAMSHAFQEGDYDAGGSYVGPGYDDKPDTLMAYDAKAHRMIRQVLCSAWCHKNHTSVLAWTPPTWTPIATEAGPYNETGQDDLDPPAANQARPVFDPTQNVGPARAMTSNPVTGAIIYVERADGVDTGGANRVTTWQLSGTTWKQLPASAVPSAYPLPYAMLAPNPNGGDVLFDGTGNTWTWDGTTWTKRNGSGPGVRAGVGMAYDPDSKTVILYGGVAAAPGGMYADTWTWDGARWQRAAGPAGALAVPNAWTQPDPPVSLNKHSRDEMVAWANKIFQGPPVTRVAVKLVRHRDVVAMGLDNPGGVGWGPWTGTGPAEQPGRLEWVVVAFCDNAKTPSVSCTIFHMGSDVPLRWKATTFDALGPLPSTSPLGGEVANATTEPIGWHTAVDLSLPKANTSWILPAAFGTFGALALVGLVWRVWRRRRRRALEMSHKAATPVL